MPTRVMKEVWISQDGKEHASETAAIRYERHKDLVAIFLEDGDDQRGATSAAYTILDYADDIIRILTTKE